MAGAILALFGAIRRIVACSIAGALGATAANNTVTGTARAVTVDASNSGKLDLSVSSLTGADVQYSINGGVFTTFAGGATITMTNGQTLQIRATGCTSSGVGATFLVTDHDTGTVLNSPGETCART